VGVGPKSRDRAVRKSFLTDTYYNVFNEGKNLVGALANSKRYHPFVDRKVNLGRG